MRCFIVIEHKLFFLALLSAFVLGSCGSKPLPVAAGGYLSKAGQPPWVWAGVPQPAHEDESSKVIRPILVSLLKSVESSEPIINNDLEKLVVASSDIIRNSQKISISFDKSGYVSISKVNVGAAALRLWNLHLDVGVSLADAGDFEGASKIADSLFVVAYNMSLSFNPDGDKILQRRQFSSLLDKATYIMERIDSEVKSPYRSPSSATLRSIVTSEIDLDNKLATGK